MESLNGKVAVVTGASRGIGQAVAVSLAKAGASVVLASRNAERLEDVRASIEASGGKAAAVPTDVASEASVEALAREVESRFGGADILVNNAGYGVFSKVIDMRTEDFDGMFGVNVRGVFLCTRAFLPVMIARQGGQIINIASLAGKNSFVGGAGYSATKFALIGFARSLMLEVRDSNIRVVTICPGSVNTEFSDHSHDAETIIQPEDIAETVRFALTMPGRTNVSEIDVRPTRVVKK
ncbi:MAG: SDR family oxidoreductase [Acidobacteriota bacterium]